MNEHPVTIVPVRLDVHPNADALSIVRVGGWQVCVRTEDWADATTGAYVPPDSVLPDGLLDGVTRVRCRKLRGVYSEGLLLPTPEGAKLGDDVADVLGITHYEPEPEAEAGAEDTAEPAGFRPVYKLENGRKGVPWELGTVLYVTEKLHGQNYRCLWDGERFHVGSRTRWKGEHARAWWDPLTDEIRGMLLRHPGVVFYGELYGGVGKFPYDTNGTPRVRFFDAHWNGSYMDYGTADIQVHLLVPLVDMVLWDGDFDKLAQYAEGKTLLGGQHIREGVVVRPGKEADGLRGRAVVKIVGRGYLAKGA